MKNKKSNTALKMRKRRRLGAFIFVVVLLALAVVAVRIYNMNKPSRDAELLTLVNPWNTIPGKLAIHMLRLPHMGQAAGAV